MSRAMSAPSSFGYVTGTAWFSGSMFTAVA